ncbi:DUF4097 family beta strand repeat-containing protein [Kosmotoga pacifica]|uniref:DUF4097 domain-containing protein n=1 Tax=Kosmotoga pacifica TaxID=1330330 RepID=A0A0G2ZE39_9BACT|nr:DUF4097 family beta strand repeat-containing protein [Kosmotoga pacifica]AKI97824.1 hypothetical protein IX53_08380 [Kosmotoga pacifica]
MQRKKGNIIAGIILALGLILIGASFLIGPIDFHGFEFEDSTNYQNEYTEVFSNPQIDEIYINTINGYVRVEGWDNSDIQLEVKQRYTGYPEGRLEELFELTKPEITFLGNTLRIVTPRLTKTAFLKSYGVSMVIKVPYGLVDRVEVKTSNGDLNFSNLNTQITGDTSNGSISLFKVSGNAKLDSSNGEFYANGFTGYLYVKTSNASMELKNSKAQVFLRTSNGSIYVRDSLLTGTNNTLKTSNGRIVLDSELPESGHLELSTSNGEIELIVPYGTGAVIDADTSNGRIILDNVPVLAKEIGKTSISGSIYGGGNLYIDLSTSNSNIRISGH